MSKFNFPVCQLDKTVLCAGSQNVMFNACFGETATWSTMKQLLTGQ